MSLAAQLLAAQSRPEAERARLTAALGRAGGDAETATERVAEAKSALDQEKEALAEEAAGPRQAPPADHFSDFSESPPEPVYEDASRERPRSIRLNPRFLPGAFDPPDPEPAPAQPEPAQPAPRTEWDRDAEAAAEAPPAPLPEPDPVPEPESERPSLLSRLPRSPGIWIFAVLTAVVLVMVLVSVTTGTRGTPRTATPAVQLPPAPTEAETPAPAETDTVLVPATVSASCGNASDAVAPFTPDDSRAWVCERRWGLDGNVLNISFSGPMVITQICVVPGWNFVHPDGRDEWARHRVTTSVSWRMGGQLYPQRMTPTRTGVCQNFPSVITQEMSMTITASTRPPAEPGAETETPAEEVDRHTAIGKITITGRAVDGAAQ